MATETAMLGIMSQRTCGEACWYAREDTCVCACEGSNHGTLMVAGRPQPSRTKRVKDDRFRLVAVLTWGQRFDYRRLEHSPQFAFQAIPKTCAWPEAQIEGAWRFLWCDAELSQENAEDAMNRAKNYEDANRDLYHLGKCDGTTTYPGMKIERPCDSPESHDARFTIRDRLALSGAPREKYIVERLDDLGL